MPRHIFKFLFFLAPAAVKNRTLLFPIADTF